MIGIDRTTYIDAALRTLSSNFSISPTTNQTKATQLLHGVMGIATECGELLQALDTQDLINIREELGDICWYCAIIKDVYRGDTPPVLPSPIFQDNIFTASSQSLFMSLTHQSLHCLDLLKKVIFYESCHADTHIHRRQVSSSMDLLVSLAINVIHIYLSTEQPNFTLTDILTTNINKLRVRYPERYADIDAKQRNISAERNALDTPPSPA